MTHPYNLAAVAAWWSLRESAPWIRATITAEAYNGASGPARPLSGAALRRAGQAWREERSDALRARLTVTDTSKALGDSPTPIRPVLLDAELVANQAQFDLLALIGEAAVERIENATDPRGVLDIRTLPIHEALRELDPWRAHEAAVALAYADRTVRDAVRVGPSQERHDGMCPGCGTYGLVWETAGPGPEWTVVCAYGCRCEGEACPCGVPERVAGTAHRWEPALWSPTMIGALPSAQVTEGAAA